MNNSAPTDIDFSNRSSFKPAEYFNGVLSGPTGMGKTFLMASASKVPELSPVLIITFDREDPTLAKLANENLHVIDVPKYMYEHKKTVTETIGIIKKKLIEDTLPYRLIGVDNMSKLVNPLMYEDVLKVGIKAAHHPHDLELLEQGDYKRATKRVYDWFDALHGLSLVKGFHLFVTSREKWDYVETPEFTGDLIFPDLPPELRRLILYEFDFCYRLTASARVKPKDKTETSDTAVKTKIAGQMQKAEKELVRTLHTMPRNGVVLKDKIGIQDSKTNPTAKFIYESFMENIKTGAGV